MGSLLVISQTQGVLATYPRNLAFFLRQATQDRGARAIPVDLVFAIRFQREQIRILKTVLRGFDVLVVDEFNDLIATTEPTSSHSLRQRDPHTQDRVLHLYQCEMLDLLSV